MHKILIVGNWKMHLNVSQSSLLAHRLQETIKIHKDVEVVLAPSMLSLQPLSLQVDQRKFKLATQELTTATKVPIPVRYLLPC
jgi:triosephosphate isomerase